MKSCMTRCLKVMTMMSVLPVLTQAEDRTWTGAEDNRWANAKNWSPNAVPGTVDCAVFDGPSAQTTIDLSDAPEVGKIAVKQTNKDRVTPKYTLGTSSDQRLRMPFTNCGGDPASYIIYGIFVYPDVAAENVPEIVATIGGNVYGVTDAGYSYLPVQNASAGVLRMGDYGGLTSSPDKGSVIQARIAFTGNGPSRVSGEARFESRTPGVMFKIAPALFASGKVSFDNPIVLGESVAGSAALEVSGDVDLDGNFTLGRDAGASGAIYQRGGVVTVSRTTSPLPYVGSNGWGFYELAGGKLFVTDQRSGLAAYARLSQVGGLSSYGDFYLGYGHELADWVVSDGTSGILNYLHVLNGGVKDRTSVVTVEGSASATIPSFVIPTPTAGNGTTVIANLNGGTWNGDTLGKGGSAGPEIRFFVNFNGGTFRPRGTATSVLNGTPSLIEAVTVHAGGAIVDTSAVTAGTVDSPCAFTKPTGVGVRGVSLPDDFAVGIDFLVGPPSVKILGTGTGATALCDFDSATRRLSGVRVTCPGRDYAGVAKAVFDYGMVNGGRRCVTNDCVMTDAAPASGPFVKRGAGELRFNAANTYGGDTVIEAGSIKLMRADAVPQGSSVRLKGGLLTAAAGVTMPAYDFKFTVGETISYPGTFAFPSGSTVSLEGVPDESVDAYVLATFDAASGTPALKDSAVAERWRVCLRDNELILIRRKGLVLIFR